MQPENEHALRHAARPLQPEPILAFAESLGGGSPVQDSVNVQEYISLFRRRWPLALATAVLVLGGVLTWTLAQRKLYQATVTLDLEQPSQDMLDLKGISLNMQPDAQLYLQTQYKILDSESLAHAVIEDLHLADDSEFAGAKAGRPGAVDSAAQVFASRLDVAPVSNSNIVMVRFAAWEPQLAARVANRLADDYIQRGIQQRIDSTSEAADLLSHELAASKTALEKAENALQQYSARNGLVFLDKQEKQDVASARLQQLEDEYTKAEAARIQWESEQSQLTSGRLPPDAFGNSGIQQLQLQIADLQKQYANALVIYKPAHPVPEKLKAQINALQTSLNHQLGELREDIRERYRAAVTQQDLLGQAVNTQKAVVNQLAARTVQYNVLERQADSARTLYEGLLERMKNAEVDRGLDASSVHVVDTAQVPTHPWRPVVWLNLLAGIFGAALLGTCAALLQEHLDNTFKTADDLSRTLGVTTLGIIPAMEAGDLVGQGVPGRRRAASDDRASGDDGRDALLPSLQAHSDVGEAFRSIRTVILLGRGASIYSIVVTSSLPAEGKSTVARNLAALYAELGRRVLLIDADLRKPTVHRNLQTRFHPGLADYLEGQANAKEIVHSTALPNLCVIPFGHMPSSPADLLMGPAMANLLEELRSDHDVVFIDTPPAVQFADCRVLAPIADAVLFVVRCGRTPREAVVRSLRSIQEVNGRVLGIVMNDVNKRSEGYGYYYGTYQHYYRQEEEEREPGSPGARTTAHR